MPGITHMMMLDSDEGFGHDSNDVMDVILGWSNLHISKMPRQVKCPSKPHKDKKKKDKDDDCCR